MGAYTVKNLKEVDNQAVHFGLEPSQLELRMARVPLECENSGVSYLKLGPGFRVEEQSILEHIDPHL